MDIIRSCSVCGGWITEQEYNLFGCHRDCKEDSMAEKEWKDYFYSLLYELYGDP